MAPKKKVEPAVEPTLTQAALDEVAAKVREAVANGEQISIKPTHVTFAAPKVTRASLITMGQEPKKDPSYEI